MLDLTMLPLSRTIAWMSLALLGFAPIAHAADPPPLTFMDAVPMDGLDHFFIPFDVPPGVQEIEVQHDDLSEANILDFGLVDPSGYRGWGGGTNEPAIVGVQAASRAYVPGPIAAGTWRVVVGKAKLVELPAHYKVVVIMRTTPTLAPNPDRAPYVPPAALASGRRYYAGDLHVHSKESTDAVPELETVAAYARSRGLDFVEVSDHNTITQLDFFNAVQARHPDLLLLPGIEFTTYNGHANAIGATRWVDHKIGQPGVTIAGAIDAVHAQGALFTVNHPVIPGGSCIGCAWKHDVDPHKLDGVEIETGAYSKVGWLFTPQALMFWENICGQGVHAAAVGGSDDHHAGEMLGGTSSWVGSPTTMVLADALTPSAIVDGIRHGHTVIKLEDATDPMIELTAGGSAVPGDTFAGRKIELRVKVTGANLAAGAVELQLVKNGTALPSMPVTKQPFEYVTTVDAPATGEDRYRAVVLVNGDPHTITSYVWLKLDPNAATGGGNGGCSAAPGRGAGAAGVVALGAAALAALWLTRMRGRQRRLG